MTPHAKLGIAGVVIGLILLFIARGGDRGLIGPLSPMPAAAWMMLDESQRRRYRELRRRQRGELR